MMTDGSRLNGCGGAPSPPETTPTPASAVAVGVPAGAAGTAVPAGEADAAGVTVEEAMVVGAGAGEAGAADRAASAACPLGDAAAVVELGAAAEPDGLPWHPARVTPSATPSPARRASAPKVCFPSLTTRYARTGCNTNQRNGALKVRTR